MKRRSNKHDLFDFQSNPPLPLDWSGLQPSTPSNPDQRSNPGSSSGSSANPNSHADPNSSPPIPEVLVRTSARRKKTATAYWEGGKIVALVPARLKARERDETVKWLVDRVLASRAQATRSDEELMSRAIELGRRYLDGVSPKSIRWVSNQSKRWGSCTAENSEIRLSHRLQALPSWVLDAVIIHELAHLVHPNHSKEFHALVKRYPKSDEASTFLDGYSIGLNQARDENTIESA